MKFAYITGAITKTAIIGLSLFSFNSLAHAKGYKVEAEKCTSPKGTIAVSKENDRAWSSLDIDSPDLFLESLVAESECFTIVRRASSADYVLSAGPLTKEEYEAGPQQFSGSSAIQKAVQNAPVGEEITKTLNDMDSVLKGDLAALENIFSGKSKMQFAYIDITTKSGEVVARGFGRNNRSGLDYSHWTTHQEGIADFTSTKKALRVSGSIFNAYDDAYATIDSGNFGQSTYTSAPISATSAPVAGPPIKLSDLLKEKSKNPARFQKKYGDAAGGVPITLLGYVKGIIHERNITIVGSEFSLRSVSLSSEMECLINGQGSSVQSAYDVDRGTPVTVTGSLTTGEPHSGFNGPMAERMILRSCHVTPGAWE